MDTVKLYNELRRAVVDYFAIESTSDEVREAYSVLTHHIKRGALPDNEAHAKRVAAQNRAAVLRDFARGSR